MTDIDLTKIVDNSIPEAQVKYVHSTPGSLVMFGAGLIVLVAILCLCKLCGVKSSRNNSDNPTNFGTDSDCNQVTGFFVNDSGIDSQFGCSGDGGGDSSACD